MPYYHVYTEYVDKKGGKNKSILFNLSKKDVEKKIAIPFMKNKAIPVYGDFTHPRNITKLNIFASKKPYELITLPNRKRRSSYASMQK